MARFLLSLIYVSTSAAGFVIDFGSDPTRTRVLQGFTSADSPLVRFYDSEWVSGDGGMVLFDYEHQSTGNALAFAGTATSDTSFAIMEFAVAASNITFDFGNDDPRSGIIPNEDQALLQVFRSDFLVGTRSVTLNGNDDMDQSIGFSGSPFDRVHFQYVDRDGNTKNVAEIIDNIQIQAVPEPTSLLLAVCGGLAFAGARMQTLWRRV